MSIDKLYLRLKSVVARGNDRLDFPPDNRPVCSLFQSAGPAAENRSFRHEKTQLPLELGHVDRQDRGDDCGLTV